eukprot:CAMPEP_0198725646 /NCGR_PEP_ID=MMETSP1475-20131203/2916_1 /TAXON_ID= ORGANISM="Unidentified sp., Strain CCMP1999" /NCGR_SAMPLE_ID=MMETSP1475 /ASSEMBLY_ACC=CAM_ASM_001111 /LENGTH=32 /DNA_ID= /DNA_START= /DNA_END= /DNA_ORIENTATION=
MIGFPMSSVKNGFGVSTSFIASRTSKLRRTLL